MKQLVKEILFPAYGSWSIEAFAWSKELARRLNAPFRMLLFGDVDENAPDISQQLLRGDGYYFGHYHQAPAKTHLTSLRESLAPQFINFLRDSSGLAVIVLDPSKPIFQDDSVNLSHHIVLAIPNPIVKTPAESEFVSILRQISILNMPFDFAPEAKQSWFSKLVTSLRVLL